MLADGSTCRGSHDSPIGMHSGVDPLGAHQCYALQSCLTGRPLRYHIAADENPPFPQIPSKGGVGRRLSRSKYKPPSYVNGVNLCESTAPPSFQVDSICRVSMSALRLRYPHPDASSAPCLNLKRSQITEASAGCIAIPVEGFPHCKWFPLIKQSGFPDSSLSRKTKSVGFA